MSMHGTHVHTNGQHRADMSPDALEADIAKQREALAHTVQDLQAKLDVKARAQDKAAELKDRATTDTGRPRPEVVAGLAAAFGALAALMALKIRHRRHH